MKKYFLLSIVAIFIVSCKDEIRNAEGFALVFYPRKVSYIYFVPGKQVVISVPGPNGEVMQYTKYEDLDNGVVSENKFSLVVGTSNCNLFLLVDYADYEFYKANLDKHIPDIERQIDQDYRKDVEQRSSGTTSGKSYMNLIDLEYRTTPIRNLTISALNTPLFGKPAGESLNDFFDVIVYNPPAIVSYPSNNLVYGYTSKKYPKAIDEWLSLYPYAQVGMRFAPNKPISGLPIDVQFVVRMETHEGLVLSDTTRLFTITE